MFLKIDDEKIDIWYTKYTVINHNPWISLLLSSIQYHIYYSISPAKKNEGKRVRERARETILEEYFSIQQGEDTAIENNGTGYTSLYGLGGLIGREVDNQDHVGPRWERSSRGYWLVQPPPGELALSLDPVGLTRSPGSETVEPAPCRGPIGTRQETHWGAVHWI